ncbi:MAG: hypothetical protein AMJ68_05705, partial [Acidithiobacillales bacterium SG8_45]
WKTKHPKDYLQHAGTSQGISGNQQLTHDDLPLEFMMNALRLVDGFPTVLFGERTGMASTGMIGPLERAEELGLVERDAIHIRPTARGQQYLNDLLALFIKD